MVLGMGLLAACAGVGPGSANAGATASSSSSALPRYLTGWTFTGTMTPEDHSDHCLSSFGAVYSPITILPCGDHGWFQQWVGIKLCRDINAQEFCNGVLTLISTNGPPQGGALGSWRQGSGEDRTTPVICPLGSTTCLSEGITFTAQGFGTHDTILFPWSDGAALTWPRTIRALAGAKVGSSNSERGDVWAHPEWEQASPEDNEFQHLLRTLGL